MAQARLTLVYQHELPNVLGKSVKRVLVEYPPKLLAVYVVDTNETELTTPLEN